MKKQKIFLATLGLIALGLTACSSENLGPLEPEKVTMDQTRFISVQISAPAADMTRAFQNGSEDESYVYSLDFLFYDVNGNPTSAPHNIQKSEIEKLTPTTNPNGSNVTKMYTSVVPVSLTQGQNIPAQVVCIVNGRYDIVNTLKQLSLDGLRDETRNFFVTNNERTENKESFLMCNSVYFGQDLLTGQPNQRICATPINSNSQLFETKEKAEQAIEDANKSEGATDAGLVNIYVERVAAKVGLTLDKDLVEPIKLLNGDTPDNADDEVSLTFVPQYWTVNAADRNCYLSKRYGLQNGNEINWKPTYEEIADALNKGGFTTWNDPANKRSYWGCSPSYYANSFPYVSDDVNDLDGNVADPKYPVNYYSYNEIVAESEKTNLSKQALSTTDGSFIATIGEDTSKGFIYTFESTVGINTINNIQDGNPVAAVASVVLAGQYKNGANLDDTFYIDRHVGTNGTYYGSETTAKEALAARQLIVFSDQNGTTPAPASRFALMHPVKSVRDLLGGRVSGRLVTLQLTQENITGNALYYYDSEGNKYVQITAANLDDVNYNLVTVGYLDMYANGHAFFSIPIRHLNFKTDDINANGEYLWENMNIGAIGVVRNHVYNLTISKISGLATGLRSDNQPIVPPKNDLKQYIAMRLNILSWNIANTWNVEL